MTLYAHLRTPRETCYAIERVAETKFGKLTPRPWDIYEPDTTSWWLVPSSDWPAYKYGKFHFDWGEDERDSIFLGLYIEKGLDPSVSSVYSCPKGLRHIMHNDWTWFRLIRDLENGQIPQKVKSFASDLPTPLELIVDGGYVQDPCDFDPYAPQLQWHQYLFEWDTISSRFVLKSQQSPAEVFGALSQLRTLDDLPSILKAFTSNAWLWVDFFMGIRFQILDADLSKEATPVWGASDFWANFLCHLSPWLI